MVKDIVKDQWIDFRLYVFGVNKNQLKNTIKKLSIHAQKLGWKVYKDESNKNKIDIYIAPENKLLSPLHIEETNPEIIQIVKKIKKEFKVNSNEGWILIENVDENDPKSKRNRRMTIVFQDIAVLSFKLRDRIILEETNFPLANIVFRSSLYFDFEPRNKFRIFLNKISKTAENKSREKVKKILYEACNMNYSKN